MMFEGNPTFSYHLKKPTFLTAFPVRAELCQASSSHQYSIECSNEDAVMAEMDAQMVLIGDNVSTNQRDIAIFVTQEHIVNVPASPPILDLKLLNSGDQARIRRISQEVCQIWDIVSFA